MIYFSNSLQTFFDVQTAYETTWAPILWAVNLLQRERTSGRLTIEAPVYARLIEAFDYIDSCNRQIFNHGWVNFPLGSCTISYGCQKDFWQ
jgi:hypothetical protein